MNPVAALSESAAALLAEIEAAGVRATIRGGRLVLAPGERLGPAMRQRVRAALTPLIALLRSRGSGEAPSPTRSDAACELRRFPDWRQGAVVRFCCEPDHRHEDGVLTYDLEECSLIVAWSAREGMRSLPISLRNALLDMKALFGGRILRKVTAQNAIGRTTPS